MQSDVLESWKEIAAYLNRTVRTVQRWEKLEGLPVHRLGHARQATVCAYRAELDAWWAEHQVGAEPQPPTSPVRRWLWPVIAGCLCVVVIAAALGAVWVFRRPVPTLRKVAFRPIGIAIPEAFPAMSPEGNLLVQATQSGALRLTRLANGSSDEILPPTGLKHMGMVFSPDAESVYFVAVRPGERSAALYRIGAAGGNPARLKENVDSPVSFSPDGRRYVFMREQTGQNRSTVIITNIETGQETPIASRSSPEYLDYPSWSPDGQTIACTLINQKLRQAGMVVIRVSDGRERPLTEQSWGFLRKTEWLQDGSGLLTSGRDKDPGGYQLWHVAYPGGQSTRLTTDLDHYIDVNVCRRAHTAVVQQAKVLSSIWVVALDDPAAARQFTEARRGKADVAWMPEGEILFAPSDSNEGGIWVMGADGGARRRISDKGQFPAACGDGRVVFRLGRQLWIADRDGSNRRLLFRDAGDSHHDCASDSDWIAYTTAEPGKRSTLWRISTAGGDPRELSSAFVRSPAISPDGLSVAAFYSPPGSSSQTSVNQVAVIPATGGPPARTYVISADVDYATGVRWSPDGMGVTYVDRKNGVDDIWLQPLDGAPRRLTNFRGDHIASFAWSFDGKQLVLARSSEMQELLLMRW